MQLLLNKVESMMESKLNAFGSANSHWNKPSTAGQGNRVPGLTREELSRLQSEGRCFFCKEKGHMKTACPKMNKAPTKK